MNEFISLPEAGRSADTPRKKAESDELTLLPDDDALTSVRETRAQSTAASDKKPAVLADEDLEALTAIDEDLFGDKKAGPKPAEKSAAPRQAAEKLAAEKQAAAKAAAAKAATDKAAADKRAAEKTAAEKAAAQKRAAKGRPEQGAPRQEPSSSQLPAPPRHSPPSNRLPRGASGRWTIWGPSWRRAVLGFGRFGGRGFGGGPATGCAQAAEVE